MKIKNSIIIAFAIFLYCNSAVYAQGTNIVTLNVNTEVINDDNVLDECFFSWEDPDGNIVTSGTGPELEDWLITIGLDSEIEWQGISSSEDNKIVNIIQIKRQSGTRIFDGKTLKGDRDSNGEKVRGKPMKKTNNTDGDYKYNIKFKVKDVRGTFNIDPKIKVE
ncbi:MAG: hypothetical protein KJO53_13490 [Eudoraea sp.]|nr:hypothetical protein [Eudoraea sp.]MBT8293318.1 hypothetical protein [Eudoraea sp.]NNL01058.1 hypothetical protein [Eudoraea sp.]